MYRNILIATDGSELSAKGVQAGLDLAKASGAKVTIVIASEPFPAYDLGTRLGFFTDQQAVEAYGAGCQKIADAALSSARKAAEEAGVACDTLHVANSVPGKAILETAAARSCDLIVLTSHGRHGFERFLLGSTASRVVQSAEISVLVVR
ncbi:universal stress protein [Amaricoccus sp.]|uniref:universal stress protein n=1 Tax=Amaricoccus sp. TaxID=1872485 RepID=UPI00261B9C78|nr:universal stress protein [Amaricoccus sp.]HRO11330.1 universal stress protein [Amaricoccus sp.]